MNSTIKGVIVGTLGTLLATMIIFFVSRGKQVLDHVDAEAPVSFITQKQSAIESKTDSNTNILLEYGKSIDVAVTELQLIRMNLLRQPVKGTATREAPNNRTTKNIIYVNAYSDARGFRKGEILEIVTASTKIYATVEGDIFDTKPGVIGKLNAAAADSLGLTWKAGVMKDVTIRRTEKCAENALKDISHPKQHQ